jgi:polar amino acid transport system substrate-binding protein
MSNRTASRTLRLSIALTTVGIMLAGCGSSPTASTNQSTANNEVALEAIKTDDAARDLLPAEVRSSETLRIATALKWPPFAFKNPDSGAPTGLDVELTSAVARKLGLKEEISDMAFPGLIPGVKSGRYDIAANQLEDSPARRKEVELVIYANAHMGVLTKKGGPEISPSDLCGRKLGVTQGTTQIQLLTRLSESCTNEGKQGISQEVFPDSASTVLAVSNGRAEGFVMNTATGKYMTETTATNLTLQPGTIPDAEAKVGIVVAPGSKLADAVRAAIQSLIDDGTYARLFQKYGMEGDKIEKSTLASTQ